MAGLVERLMKWDGNPNPIATHTFFAGCTEIGAGVRTVAQFTSYFNMTAEEVAEFNLMVEQFTGLSAANKALKLGEYHAVFLLARERVPFYSTPGEVRSRLGLP